jgi:hypothetical protein
VAEPSGLDTHSPPKDDPISVEDLKQYDGTDESKPVYVAVKGTVFDVSPKREMYGTFDFRFFLSRSLWDAVLTDLMVCGETAPGKGYNVFAGKDGSRGLGMSSLKPEDAVPDYSTLDDKQLKVLDDWVCIAPPRCLRQTH